MKPTDLPTRLNEDGEHDEESCYPCLAADAADDHLPMRRLLPASDHRGCCSRREVEPRIKERGDPIYTPAALTGIGKDDLSGYLLNSPDNGRACTLLRPGHEPLHHPRHPALVCRLFNCDGDDREELVELGILPPRDAPES